MAVGDKPKQPRVGNFPDPFVLRSEHRRVIDGLYERFEVQLQAATRTHFWRGVAMAVSCSAPIAMAACCIAFGVGYAL